VVGARQQHGKHVSVATNKHAAIEELLEVVFSIWSSPRLYSMDPATEKSWSWISKRLKQGMTALAKASSKLTDQPRQSQVVLLAATT
jgi:tellurite resistance protein